MMNKTSGLLASPPASGQRLVASPRARRWGPVLGPWRGRHSKGFNAPPCAAFPAADDGLSSEFASFLLKQKGGALDYGQVRAPSPLLAPHAVVAAQMAALQRNDWPQADAGIQAAFAFAMPQELSNPQEGQLAIKTGRSRSWLAAESWLTFAEFSALLNTPPYKVMLGCDSWKEASPPVFTGSRSSSRAVQVVHVHAPAAPPAPPKPKAATTPPPKPPSSSDQLNLAASDSQSSASTDADTAGRWESSDALAAWAAFQKSNQAGGAVRPPSVTPLKESGRRSDVLGEGPLRQYTFSFCLQQVEVGPAKGVWFTVGVRVGDYSG